MGCCLVAAVLIGAPRLALFLWWLADPARIYATFASWAFLPAWAWGFLGFLLLPWTTVAYVFVAPGGLSLFDWVILALALLIDLSAHGGGGEAYRRRQTSY